MDCKDRGQVSAAADVADRLLAEDPLQDSIYLNEQLRRRDFPPLRFFYEVREEDRLVVISNVTMLSE